MIGFPEGVLGMPTVSTSPAPDPDDSLDPLWVRELLFHHLGLTMRALHDRFSFC